MAKAPAFQFYPGDWRRDVGVQSLDYEHRGMWIELLCMMWFSDERGRLVLPSGAPLPDGAIARNLGIEEAEWKQKRSTLLTFGVASEDESGVFYNRRMVRDEATRRQKADAGRKGGLRSRPPSKTEAKRGSAVATATATALNSASKDTGASPVVENSENEQSDEFRGEFAQLVRRHLWQSKEPPAKDWTMGREYSIRDRLIAQGESPEIINAVYERYRGPPATGKIYWAKDSRPRWEIDKNECLKSQPARVPKGLPTVGEVLSELGGAA